MNSAGLIQWPRWRVLVSVAACCGVPDTGGSGRLNWPVLDGFWDFENGPTLSIRN